MKKTRRNARGYDSQEKYAESLNAARKNAGINRFHRQVRSEEGRQWSIELLFQLFRRADCLEQELTEIRQQLNEIACKVAAGRCAALQSQSLSSQPPHRDGSRRKTAYLLLGEDLIPVESPAWQNYEAPVRSSEMRRAVDEL